MTGLAPRQTGLPRLGATVAALLAALALAAAGCGGDDEDERTDAGDVSQRTEATAPETAPSPADTVATEPERTGAAEGGGATAPAGESPEDQPSGAGDEVPASSQALITGRGGRLRPAVVHVPPFIAVRVQLRSADGVEYELRGGGRQVRAGGEIESASTTFDGLRPGKRLVLSGPQGRVAIEANAEPGP